MDYLGHLVARINSAIKAGDLKVIVPRSKFNIMVLQFLERSGYILSFIIGEKTVTVFLNYYKGKSMLSSLKRVSKPGRRIYVTNKELVRLTREHKNYIILSSAEKNLLWLWQINMLNQGGEILIEVN